MTNSFTNLGVSDPILKAITEMGFENPTEVQSQAIPHILNQKDLIVHSKTGSGKTAVFGVSMLQLTDADAAGPQGLILTPTRELAVQVDRDLQQIAKYLPHKTTAVYGQHNMKSEIQALNEGRTIVTGTPGRVHDHIRQRNLKTKNIRFLVLDEADRMLDMGFIDEVVSIIRTIPKQRVTLLFSATIPPEIHRICRQHMKNPETISIESETKTVDTIEQRYYRVERNEKRKQLDRLLSAERPESCMIFCNTKHEVDRVQAFLQQRGYASEALHGDVPQSKRIRTIDGFKKGKYEILVATDVASRGIHIDELSLVINYDVPLEKDNYVHRIGRTGRTGLSGRAVSLVTSEDIMSLYEIEEHIGALIQEAELPEETAVQEGRRHRRQIVAERAKASGNASSKGERSAAKKDSAKTGTSSSRSSNRRRRPSKSSRSGETQSGQAPKTDARTVKPLDNKRTQTKRRPTADTAKQTERTSAQRPATVTPIAEQTPKPTPTPQPKTADRPTKTDAGGKSAAKSTGTAKKPLLKRVFQKLLGS